MDWIKSQGDNPTDRGDDEPSGDSLPFEFTDGSSETFVNTPDSVASHPSGQVIDSRFKVEEELGRGGMGVVYKVWDQTTRQRCALKAMLPSILSSKKAVERFMREINTSRSLQHPGIVRVLDVGNDGPLLYFTMEYLEGKSLRSYLDE